MAGQKHKSPNALTGHREAPDLAVLQKPSTSPSKVPDLPPGRWLAVTRERWALYWKSPIAGMFDRESDDPVILTWIRDLDEYERAYRQLKREKRVVEGSTGQPRLNPLIAYIDELKRSMRVAESQLGIGALNRVRLGLGASKLAPHLPGEGEEKPTDWDADLSDGVTWVER